MKHTTLNKWLVCLVLMPAISGSAYAQNVRLAIKPGTTMKVANNVLVLQNTDLQSDGTLDASAAKVVVTGTNNTSFGGAGMPSINDLDLNTSTGSKMSLAGLVEVSGTLNFQQGLINLNNHLLQLTGAGVLQNESETAHLTGATGGSVSPSTALVTNPVQLNIGNLGASLSSTASLGTVTVTRTHKPATDPGNSSLHGIQRTYLIQPQNNTALNATLRFYYLDEELDGDDPSMLSLWKSTNGVTWTQIGFDSRNPTAKYVEKSGLADLSYWTLTDLVDPLPLTLLSFQAICQENYAMIGWRTGTESQISHFEIERSEDGSNFSTIGTVEALNNPGGSNYSFKDEHPLASSYYRLKIVDMSGAISYSPVFSGGCSDMAMPFSVYPNPAASQAIARLSVRAAANAVIQIRSITGQMIFSANWSLQPGTNQFVLPVSSFAAGTYVVNLLMPSGNNSEAILIKK